MSHTQPVDRRGPGQPGPAFLAALALIVTALSAATAQATPTTTFWAPSTALCQGYRLPHVSYDTYFGKGPTAGSQGAPNYPIDTGVTMGVLPYSKIQAEVGFDLLLPTNDPLLLNAKLCAPESAYFKGMPALSVGMYNVGFKKDVTDYNMLHVVAQKSLPFGGYVAAGVYHGFSDVLFTNSDGEVKRTGLLAAYASPDVLINRKGLKKFNIVADVQSGKNVFGGWGFGANVYFADNVSVLTGPVFYLDKEIQPGGKSMLWTLQLDIDIPVGR
jgi:hypothetical protein